MSWCWCGEPGFAAGANGGGAISSSNAFGAASAGSAAAGAFGSTSNGGFSRAASTAANVTPVYRAINLGWSAGTAIGAEIHRDYGDRLQPMFDWIFDRTIGEPKRKALSPADVAQKDIDHDNYHKTCDQKPPENLTPCEKARWHYRQGMACQLERQEWEERWGHPQSKAAHERALANVKMWLKNAANDIARYCTCPE